ncbi:hypothetical protein DOY81_007410, partial [Sarcophaga bullata]
DVISGANNLESGIKLQRDLCNLLNKECCKWISNSFQHLREIPEEHKENSQTLQFDKNNVVKTLDIQWDTCDCDTPIPTEIEKEWSKYRSSLEDLVNLKIPRWINWSP